MSVDRSISSIRVRGARQNNLKGIDVEIPLGKLTVVTGASGSGKSSLAFQTLYAEGQRRYVETFSPYTRQFFDRMDKPKVDSIDGIPPAIAIEQQNAVKSTRSTVGTITEVNDYLKLLFPRVCQGFDPISGEEIKPETPESIFRKSKDRFGKDAGVMILFSIAVPKDSSKEELFDFLQQQGYLRVVIFGKVYRTDDPAEYKRKTIPASVDIVQDRLKLNRRARFLEAVERALYLGRGQIAIADPDIEDRMSLATGWSNPETGVVLPEPIPNLFSFNHPAGACPECRGFGRVIGIDIDKSLPDKSLSIAEGVVRPFQGEAHYECQDDLERCARAKGISLVTPFDELTDEERKWIIEGDIKNEEEAWDQGLWYGIRGFFRWLEARSYKMHVRILLSRYRSYTTCDECNGTRLKPEALYFTVNEKTLPDLWQMPIDELLEFIESIQLPAKDRAAETIYNDIRNRLFYLTEVGLSYLNLDRPTRTLSGGEIERVNLTTCLGANLTGTLFVLDEPTVGLHPRDVHKLIGVMQRLRDLGNTLVVVEHEESVIRAADRLIDIGPGRGETGGELVYSGVGCGAGNLAAKALKKNPDSLTLQYLAGDKNIPVRESNRKPKEWLEIKRASQHNLKKIDVKIPLGVFCCVSGVSGSGKSTLIHSVLYENAARKLGLGGDEQPGACRDITNVSKLENIVMVDQSPLAKTPRSTPAVYTGIFENIRKLFAESMDGKSRAVTPGYFSFNSGHGRCERCLGTGYEKVEMQFLSDLFVTCPECEGKRYTPDALEINFEGKNIHEALSMTVTTALGFFDTVDDRKATRIVQGLQLLADVGLGYLRLGQPLTTLSGGESQRLKLVGHLIEKNTGSKKKTAQKKSTLLIFDEPTTGLHFDDVKMLLAVFDRLVESGDSVVVIEHNLDVIKSADYVIELGPQAGVNGGEVVFTGTPKKLAAHATSETGRYLAEYFYKSGKSKKPVVKEAAHSTGYSPELKRVQSATQQGTITLTGARENNLKNFDLTIPRDKFVVITGLSGSGKSTLAFDILFAEGQRRFLDSMSTYARQFVEQMERPDVDSVTGLPPTVAIEQRISRGGGKSTVATVTEVWHFLRLLYSKVGIQYSPDTGNRVQEQSITAIVTQLRKEAKKSKKPIFLMAPLIKGRKGFHTEVAEWAGRQGFETLFVDGEFKKVEGFQRLARFKEHFIDVVVEEIDHRAKIDEIREALETALKLGRGTARFIDHKGKVQVVSTQRCDPDTGRSFEELDPRLFSYNSPHGFCPNCRGYGTIEKHPAMSDDKHAESQLDAELREEYRRSKNRGEQVPCPECEGARLNEVARHVRVGDLGVHEIAAMSVREAGAFVEKLQFTGSESIIARDIIPEISQRLHFMEEVGLSYLQLDRSATTLSGGESQRIRLAAQLGSNLRGVLYVLDEPTIGLHPRDNDALLDTLTNLRNKGNSLVVVEHDDETILRSDYLIDLGPGAGELGGEIVWQGTPDKLQKLTSTQTDRSPTARILSQNISHPINGKRRTLPAAGSKESWIKIEGASANNLKNINVRIPIGRLTVIAGISGSGKSSFMRGVLKPAVNSVLKKGRKDYTPPVKKWKSVKGAEHIEAIYEVDQSPIGKTSRSTPATYVKVFDEIRKVFAQLPESRARGYTASRFSFNTEGGRCEPCKGNGNIKLEMNFLPTSYVECDECRGRRYNSATLEVLYNGKSIADVMEMSISEAAEFFKSHSKIHRTLNLMTETGLSYLRLGQASPTLSGGEAQRIKLVTELTKGIGRANNARLRQNRAPKSNLYLIEEPSIGLHGEDVIRLINIMHYLVDDGHTVVVIEHNLEIMAEADYLIEIGPEAGDEGGKVVGAGKPERVIQAKESRTGKYLAKLIG
ncbi:MAG: excinuclease ABC subunit UvrA [Verrucomicrobiales bacterium]|nr:excinuclease ABC subunit UvrA [Verrucomicrobiales bacterium]